MFEWTTPKKKTWWERFSDQPHQLFFAATIFWAITIMALTMVSLISKKTTIDFSLIHGFGAIYGILTNAFLGFLLTVIPKYTNGPLIKKDDYISLWFIFEIGLLLSFFGTQLIGKAFVFSAMIFCAVLFTDTISKAINKKQSESIWLSIIILIGGFVLAANVFFGFELFYHAFWLYLLPLVFVVAQRMIPAFHAVYHNLEVKSKPIWFIPFFIVCFWAIGFGGEYSILAKLFSIVLFIGLCIFLAKQNIFKKSPAILWILTLGLLWLIIGTFFVVVENIFEFYSLKLGLHTLALGFVGTLLIGFGTRVILGHSNQKIVADKISISLFITTQFIVIFRIIASILHIQNSSAWIGFVHLSLTLWIVLFIAWAVKFAPTVLRLKN